MNKRQHKDATLIGNLRVCNSILKDLPQSLYESEVTPTLEPTSKRFVARVLGHVKLDKIISESRKLKYFTFDGYILIKDGDTVSYCFKG